jgi:single-strand DNA-binding protein
MPNRNVHEVMGHLGKDPELRITPTGKSVCRLSVATSNRAFDKKTQKWVNKDPDWHNVIVWGELAEKVAQEFSKGDAIMVRGKSRTREYKDKEGQKRRVTEIEAKEILKPVYVSMTIKAKDEENITFEDEMDEEADIPF